MTKEEFLQLQSDHHQSGQSLKSYLKQIGTGYSTYNYWRKKYCSAEDQPHDLAPISFRHSSPSSGSVFTGDVPSGATLLFPNGRRAGSGDGGSVGIELAVLSHQVAQRCHLHRALVIVASRSGSADRGLGDVGLAASSSAEPVGAGREGRQGYVESRGRRRDSGYHVALAVAHLKLRRGDVCSRDVLGRELEDAVLRGRLRADGQSRSALPVCVFCVC